MNLFGRLFKNFRTKALTAEEIAPDNNMIQVLGRNIIFTPIHTIENIHAFERIRVVSDIVTEIASDYAHLPLEIFKLTTTGGREGNKEFVNVSDESRFDVLLRNPNYRQSRIQYAKREAWHMLVTGATYVQPVKGLSDPIKALFLRESQFMKWELGETILNTTFIETIGVQQTEYKPVVDNKLTGDKELIPFINEAPFLSDCREPFQAWSPLDSSKSELLFILNANTWRNAFLMNGANPSAVIILKGKMNEDQWKDFIGRVDQMYTGPGKSGKINYFESGNNKDELEYITTGTAPKELDFEESMKNAEKKIASSYNVPPVYVNITESQSHANVQDQQKFYWQEAMIPFVLERCDDYNHKILPILANENERLVCRPNFDNVIHLQEDVDNKRKQLLEGLKMGSVKLNEWRVALGLEPLEGKKGELRLIPINMIPIDELGKVSSNLEKYLIREEPAAESTKLEELQKASPRLTALWREKDAELQAIGKRYAKETNDVWAIQEKKYLKNLKTLFNKEGKGYIEIHKQSETQIENAMSLDLEASLKAFMKEYRPVDILNITAAFERIAKEIKAETIGLTKDEIERMILARAAARKAITETTNDSITRVVANGISAGKDIDAITIDIREKFEQFSNLSDGRVRTVARTETIGISNEAEYQAQINSGIVEARQWLTQRDGKVRDTHIEIEGQIRKLDESFKFKNGRTVKYPGDPGGIAEEVINCRCTTISVLKKKAKKDIGNNGNGEHTHKSIDTGEEITDEQLEELIHGSCEH